MIVNSQDKNGALIVFSQTDLMLSHCLMLSRLHNLRSYACLDVQQLQSDVLMFDYVFVIQKTARQAEETDYVFVIQKTASQAEETDQRKGLLT